MNFYHRKRRTPQVIIVSMIDIFAILLIFVIVTTTFKVPEKEQPAVTIKLPESKSATAAPTSTDVAVLTVAKDESLMLDLKKTELSELAAAVRERLEKNPKQAFAMRADEKISYGFLIKVLDALKAGGLQGNLSAFTDPGK